MNVVQHRQDRWQHWIGMCTVGGCGDTATRHQVDVFGLCVVLLLLLGRAPSCLVTNIKTCCEAEELEKGTAFNTRRVSTREGTPAIPLKLS